MDRAGGQILETVRIGFSCHQSLAILAKENEQAVASESRGLRLLLVKEPQMGAACLPIGKVC
jgi:hypothetical protein